MVEAAKKAALKFFEQYIRRYRMALATQPELLIALHQAVQRGDVKIEELRAIGAKFIRLPPEKIPSHDQLVAAAAAMHKQQGVKAAIELLKKHTAAPEKFIPPEEEIPIEVQPPETRYAILASENRTVSRDHAFIEIEKNGDGERIRLHSVNGGCKVRSENKDYLIRAGWDFNLRKGDLLQIGRNVFEVNSHKGALILKGKGGPVQDKEFVFNQSRITIGRSPDAHLHLTTSTPGAQTLPDVRHVGPRATQGVVLVQPKPPEELKPGEAVVEDRPPVDEPLKEGELPAVQIEDTPPRRLELILRKGTALLRFQKWVSKNSKRILKATKESTVGRRVAQLVSKYPHVVFHPLNANVANTHVSLTSPEKGKLLITSPRNATPTTLLSGKTGGTVEVASASRLPAGLVERKFENGKIELANAETAYLKHGHAFQIGGNIFRVHAARPGKIVLKGIGGPVNGRKFVLKNKRSFTIGRHRASDIELGVP